jgi:hypothetical protein
MYLLRDVLLFFQRWQRTSTVRRLNGFTSKRGNGNYTQEVRQASVMLLRYINFYACIILLRLASGVLVFG